VRAFVAHDQGFVEGRAEDWNDGIMEYWNVGVVAIKIR